MENYAIRKYTAADRSAWDDFVSLSKNATFLFRRDFMEYHSDRFEDYSLMVFNRNALVAVIPAHREGAVAHSHNGLTYGGIVVGEKMRLPSFIRIFKVLLKFLREDGVLSMTFKMIPPIYHKRPSDELLYALFLCQAKLFRRDALSVLDLSVPQRITKDRKQSIRRGVNHGLEIREEAEFRTFWEMLLIPNLSQKHQAKPVHSVEEIERLHRFFPENIRHFNVYHNNELVGGSTIFVTDTVAHPQYISGRADKNELGSLDCLYNYLITEIFPDKKYFDFGISNESQGRKVNEGLIFWKETFGASTITQDFYEVSTESFHLLDDVLI